MNEFLSEVFKLARQTANNIFDEIDKAVNDSPVENQDWEKKYHLAVEWLDDREEDLKDALEELDTAKNVIKVLLDGEVEKVIEVDLSSPAMKDYCLDIDTEAKSRVVVRQHKL